MSVINIAEGTRLVQGEWMHCLNLHSSQFQFLLGARVFQPHEQGGYVLKFVGVVVHKDRVLFARPKFQKTTLFDMVGTLKILRSYFNRSKSRKPIVDHLRNPEYGNFEVLREFDALTALRDWFRVHGLYSREQYRETGTGRPHWVRTIAKRSPLFMQDSVVYPSIVASRKESVFNEITALQVGVLARLMERYGIQLLAAIRDAEEVTGAVVRNWPMQIKEKAYFLQQLRSEQAGVYRTDKLQLLELLWEVLDTQLASPSSQPHIFGTTAFYAVWEDACRTEIGNDAAPSNAVNLAQPTWVSQGSDGKIQRDEHRQIPDVMLRHKDWLFIIDAKYYYPFPHARPGAPDIIKQLYYAESATHDPRKILSVFLLPLPGATSPKFLGFATIEGGTRSFTSIEAWGIDPDWLFVDYPFKSAIRAQQVIDGVLQGRDSMAKLAG